MPGSETDRKRCVARRMARGAVRLRGAMLVLLAACTSPPEVAAPVAEPEVVTPPVAQQETVAAPVAPPEGVAPPVAEPASLTAAQILRTMLDAYAHCRTYRDTGRATTKMESGEVRAVIFAPFQTAFERPDRFRFGVEISAPLVKTGWIVWRHGPAVRSWSHHDGFEKPESLSGALAALAGVSWTTSITVPGLLQADDVQGPIPMEMTGAVRLDDEDVNGSRCWCLRGREASGPTTLWIDQTSHLLLRVLRELNSDGQQGEVTITYDPVIDEAIPADLLAFGSPEG